MANTPPGESPELEKDDEREATEMERYDGILGRRNEIPESENGPSTSPGARSNGRFKSLKAFWSQQISATVPHEACRDHFGMHRPSTDTTNGSGAQRSSSDRPRRVLLKAVCCLSLFFSNSVCEKLPTSIS